MIAYGVRGLAYAAKREYDRAILDYSKGIELNPKDAVAHQNRGIAFLDTREYERAIADFSAVIQLEPNSPDPYNLRAHAYLAVGKDWQGLPDIERSLMLKPDDPQALDTRARLLEGVGKRADAIADYRRALAINPKLEGSRSALKRLGASEDAWGEWRDWAIGWVRAKWESLNKWWIFPILVILFMFFGAKPTARGSSSNAKQAEEQNQLATPETPALAQPKSSEQLKRAIWWGGGILMFAAIAWAIRRM